VIKMTEQIIENASKNRTEKNKLKIIDCDVHPVVRGGIEKLFPYMTESYIAKMQRENYSITANARVRYPHPHGRVNRIDASPGEGEVPGSNPGFVIKDYLDKFNVHNSLLIPLQPANFALTSVDTNTISTLISAFNDYFIDQWLETDRRFNLAISVNPKDPEMAVKEIERLANVPGVAGVFLPLIDISLGNKYFYPIFKAVVENNLPIVIHISGPECTFTGAPTTAGGLPSTYSERFSLISQIAQSNIANLIFQGVLEDFPDLKIVFVEWGFTWLGPLTWRMNTMWRGLRIETPWVKEPPEEYIRKNIFFTTQPLEEELDHANFSQYLSLINAKDNLLFSSDYPHWDNDMPNRTFVKLSEEIKEAIFFKNAEKVFGHRLRN
jgi:predicted TIM-barrel fold metal-dependent hydrolase